MKKEEQLIDQLVTDPLEIRKKNIRKTKTQSMIIVLIIIISFGLCLSFCVSYYLESNEDKDIIKNEVKDVYSPYRMSGNSLEKFDLSFLQLEYDNKNIVYSPLSIKYALQMLSEGTDGMSKTQIDSIIGEYSSKKYVNTDNMSFANAMFIKNSFKDKVKDDYIKNLKNKYNAEVIYDSFENADNANKWVSDKTFGLITDLFDNSIKDSDYILVNALGIDMEWNRLIQATTKSKPEDIYRVSYQHENYFDAISPIDGDKYSSIKFNNKDVKSVELGASINNYDIVKTLGEDNIRKTVGDAYREWLKDSYNYEYAKTNNQLDVDKYLDKYINELNTNYKRVDSSTDFSLYVDDSVKVFSKDLKEYNGTTLQYIGIMPINNDFGSFVKNADPKVINNYISKLKDINLDNFEQGKVTNVVGNIPLFKFDYNLSLNDDLSYLGVTDVFDLKKANLSKMIDKKSYINSVAHKANIEFSNEGIKAAAATQVGGFGSTRGGFDYLYDVPVVTIDITFDKPYIFLIRDKSSGEVWFVGTVVEPTLNS